MMTRIDVGTDGGPTATARVGRAAGVVADPPGPRRGRAVLGGALLLALAAVLVVLQLGRGPATCDRTAATPGGDGRYVTAVLGSRTEVADGARVAVGGVSDDGCRAHLGAGAGGPGWVGVGESVPVGDGTLTVLSIRRGEDAGATGGDQVDLWFAPGGTGS